jgi:hypothetical protein
VNDIRNTLFDVWNDLRARRLVPVAAVLLVGLVAAPIVLSKKAGDSAPAPAQTTTPSQAQAPKGPDQLAKVKLSDELSKGSGSSLSGFSASNPFAPPKTVLKARQAQTQTTTAGGAAQSAVNNANAGTGTTGGSGGGSGGGTGGSGGGTGGSTPQTTAFTYVLDVTFWAKGHRRQIKGMQKLDVLPNEASPLLIYMGVTNGGGDSVFLVDATLQTTGEGHCTPSRANCAFLHLGAGSEQEFTNDDGDSYRLRVDQIRKVKVSDLPAKSNAAASSKKSKSARAAVEGSPRRFVFPTLTDLVEVSAGADSTGDGKRR